MEERENRKSLLVDFPLNSRPIRRKRNEGGERTGRTGIIYENIDRFRKTLNKWDCFTFGDVRMNDGFMDDLIFVWRIVKKISRWIVILTALLCIYAIIFRSNTIIGWWKFHQLCKAEGGARFYKPVERNVGWMLKEKPIHENTKPHLPYYYNPAFFRFEKINGEMVDVFKIYPPVPPEAITYHNHRIDNFTIPADESRIVRYSYEKNRTYSFDWNEFITMDQVDEKNINFHEHEYFIKTQEKIIDLNTQNTVATHTTFDFSWDNPVQKIVFVLPKVSSDCLNYSEEEWRNFSRDIYQQGPNQ